MTDDPMHGAHLPLEARYLFGQLARRGGCMRLKPIMHHLRLEPAELVTAITELAERYWIKIIWRPSPPGTPDDAPRELADIDRLATTRFGRKKYRTTWPVV
jgi:hypothetical protein